MAITVFQAADMDNFLYLHHVIIRSRIHITKRIVRVDSLNNSSTKRMLMRRWVS